MICNFLVRIWETLAFRKSRFESNVEELCLFKPDTVLCQQHVLGSDIAALTVWAAVLRSLSQGLAPYLFPMCILIVLEYLITQFHRTPCSMKVTKLKKNKVKDVWKILV